MKNFVYLDFEYRNVQERYVYPLCVSLDARSTTLGSSKVDYWLEDEKQKSLFKDYLGFLQKNRFTFVSYSAQAEARALDALGFDIDSVGWFDLYLEYRMLLNHNHEMSYGKQLIQGKPVYTVPPKPKYERTEEDLLHNTSKAESGLSAACYKLLGIIIDTKHKTAMRDLIISGKPLSKQDKLNIIEYCRGDVAYLRRLHVEIVRYVKHLLIDEDNENYFQDALKRGQYAIETAHMEREGYPIAFEKVKNFSESVHEILFDIMAEIKELFPEIPAFELDKKTGQFVKKEKAIRDWIASQGHENWLKTDTGKDSLSLEAFTRYYNFSHDSPKDNFGAQMVRLLKTKQSLNGFLPKPPKSKRKSFFDYVGSDGRARPFFNIYGSQSARSQPSATGFIPLKAAWMRALIEPPKGRAIMTIDYGQQEFLIAAVLSKDPDMLEAYRSGDPYLYTAILSGAAPEDATKETHGAVRDKFKSTCIAKGTLIYTDSGVKPIELVTCKDKVWDGSSYRACRGAKYMGRKEVINVEGAYMTPDHLILTKRGWVNAAVATKEGKRCFLLKDAERLRKPSPSWAEVWTLAGHILKSEVERLPSINKVFRWVRRTVCKLP